MFGKISRIRAKIVHGTGGTELRAEVDNYLPLLEQIVISALKHAIGLKQEGLPRPEMIPLEIAEAILGVKYKAPPK